MNCPRRSTRTSAWRTKELWGLRILIREAFGGRAPRVLDPSREAEQSLEAMCLGCEVVVADLNPAARFILRCTLHYPRLLAGQTRPLPAFAVGDRAFATAFLHTQGRRAWCRR